MMTLNSLFGIFGEKYGGWFDGNPARLQAPSDRVLAESVSSIAGGAVSLANRAKQMDKDKDEEGVSQGSWLNGHILPMVKILE